MSDSRILVVDDEERTRTYICDGLSALGITDHAICAATAEEALAEADRAPVDLVISDVRMPGLNGLDLIRYLRQSHPDTRIILITGYSTRDIERAALSLAVEALLKKPFALEALGQAVRIALKDTRPTLPASLPAHSAEPIQHQISLLKRDTGAQWIGLLSPVGQIVSETELHTDVAGTLRALAQQGWADMMTSISNRGGPCFLYIESQPHDIYLTCIDRNYCLVLLFDRRWQSSRIGAVWLSARQAMPELAAALATEPLLSSPGPQLSLLASVDYLKTQSIPTFEP